MFLFQNIWNKFITFIIRRLSLSNVKDSGIVRTFRNKGVIWSSARTVRRRLKCRNERNPYLMLYIIRDCLAISGEEGRDDVKSARRLRPGQHTSYNGGGQWVANQ